MQEIHWQDHVDLEVHPPSFSRNPSAWSQRLPISLLAGIATVIASYMALFQWGLTATVWDPVFGDGSMKVLTSPAATMMDRWLHVPDGAFGAWGYLSEAILGLVGSTRRWQYRPWMVILFGIDVIPLGGVSALLVFTQGFIIGAWCFPCLVTAVISLILVVMAYDEVWASLRYLGRVWQQTHNYQIVWRTFCGYPSEAAEKAALG